MNSACGALSLLWLSLVKRGIHPSGNCERKSRDQRSIPKMKRCPQCNRLEQDETLGYCRADGAVLLNYSGPVSGEAGTVKFASADGSGEIRTSVPPQTITDPSISRPMN